MYLSGVHGESNMSEYLKSIVKLLYGESVK